MDFDPVAMLEISQFTDIHVRCEDPAKSLLFPGAIRPQGGMLEMIAALGAEVLVQKEKEAFPDKSFIVNFGGLSFRAQKMFVLGTGEKFALRVLRDKVERLAELGFKQYHRDLIINAEVRRKGGLVLVGGPAGAGKTTTAASIVKEWLETGGGYCLTAEDPPELPLDGTHGLGVCEQTRQTEDPHEHLCGLLRCFPAGISSILFYGEVRDAKSAAELLRISVDGHLIIATIHAGDVIECCQRMLALGAMGGEPEAKELLAKSLRLVVHQKRMDGQALQATVLEINEASAATIKNGKVANLIDAVKLADRKAENAPSL